MTDSEKIISTVDATYNDRSSTPLWYKDDIIRYMEEYADLKLQQSEADKRELELQLAAKNMHITGLKTHRAELVEFLQELKKQDLNLHKSDRLKLDELLAKHTVTDNQTNPRKDE